jgi:hypothetical protein
MTVNIDPETGIAYGVISGNRVPDLVDEIMRCGTSLTQEAYEQEVRKSLTSALDEFTHGDHAGQIVEGILSDVLSQLEPQFDEEEWTWTDGDMTYLLGHFGGAPLLWVTKSPYLTYAPACSPCVPNAGDLDLASGNDGVKCYSLAPEDLPKELLAGMLIWKESSFSSSSGETNDTIIHRPEPEKEIS